MGVVVSELAGSAEPVETPAGLAEVQGAWRRQGRCLDTGSWAEVSDVLWLQVGRHFCDVRSPLPGGDSTHPLDLSQAFSGTVEVTAGDIAFFHDIDTVRRDPSHPDQSSVHRAGSVLLERGPGFEERWSLVSLPGDPVAVAELWPPDDPAAGNPVARVVLVGDLGLAVWSGRTPGGASYSKTSLGEPGWRGPRDDTLGLDEVVRALLDGDALPDGWASPVTGARP